MKKIFIILCCFGILSAHATEMCARDDTVVIPLDATIIKTTGSGYNISEWVWWMKHDYGAIYGASACLSKKEIMMYSNWSGTGQLSNGFLLNTSADELIGTSGYYMNADSNSDIPDEEKGDYARTTCVTKLTHPMSSNWMHVSGGPSSVDSCKTLCVNNYPFYVLSSINNSTIIRSNFFNSIGTTSPWPLD